jgi:hypothetical protein
MGWGNLRRTCRCLGLGLLLTSLSLPRAVGETAWLPGQYPNPIKYPEACGRGDAVGWVCDPDNVLAKDQADGVRTSYWSYVTSIFPQASARNITVHAFEIAFL